MLLTFQRYLDREVDVIMYMLTKTLNQGEVFFDYNKDLFSIDRNAPNLKENEALAYIQRNADADYVECLEPKELEELEQEIIPINKVNLDNLAKVKELLFREKLAKPDIKDDKLMKYLLSFFDDLSELEEDINPLLNVNPYYVTEVCNRSYKLNMIKISA